MGTFADPKTATRLIKSIRDEQDQDRIAEVHLWQAVTGAEPGKPLMMNGKQIGFLGNTFRDRFPYLMVSVDDAMRFAEKFGVEVRGVIRDKDKPGFWRAVCIRDGKPISGHARNMGAAITVAVIAGVVGADA